VFERLRSAEESFQETVSEVFYRRADSDEDTTTGLFAEDQPEIYQRVRVASAFLVSGNPDRVYFDTTDAARFRPRQLDLAHRGVLRTAEFTGDGIFGDTAADSDSPLLTRESDRTGMTMFGSYWEWTTAPTRSSRESDGDPRAGDIDDVLARRLRQFLTGERIAVPPLLGEYLHHIVQEQRELLGDSSIDQNIPDRAIIEQYVQLRALHDADLLDEPTNGARENGHRQSHPTIATVNPTSDDTTHESRDERLADFIERHDLLSESPKRQAVFLLGGLVGRISAYQRAPDQDISSTLVRRYPIDYVTKQTLTQVTKEVLQMNNTYIEADDQLPSTYNARYASRLPELMLDEEPTAWSITQNELQWLYALGIAYGTNDSSIDTDEEE